MFKNSFLVFLLLCKNLIPKKDLFHRVYTSYPYEMYCVHAILKILVYFSIYQAPFVSLSTQLFRGLLFMISKNTYIKLLFNLICQLVFIRVTTTGNISGSELYYLLYRIKFPHINRLVTFVVFYYKLLMAILPRRASLYERMVLILACMFDSDPVPIVTYLPSLFCDINYFLEFEYLFIFK